MTRPRTFFLVAGARPNFMKIAPVVRSLARPPDDFDCKIVHTGQHYDREMSDVFFEELEIPKPDFHLEVGSGSHAEQTARVMTRFEKICQEERPVMWDGKGTQRIAQALADVPAVRHAMALA